MNVKTKQTIPLLTALLALIGYGVTSWGQPNEPMVRAYWSAPTEGTPVEHYIGTWESWPSEGGGDTVSIDFVTDSPDTFVYTPYAYGRTLRIRVAGVDSLGRAAIFSEWSREWADSGPPSQSSRPLLGLEMVVQ